MLQPCSAEHRILPNIAQIWRLCGVLCNAIRLHVPTSVAHLQVGNASAVLGFVGAPFTLASYIVEGGSSKNYTHIKRLAFGQPEVLHALLAKLAENVADYVRYQVHLAVLTCLILKLTCNCGAHFGGLTLRLG